MKTPLNTTEHFSLGSTVSCHFSTWLNNKAGLSFILLLLLLLKNLLLVCVSFVNTGSFIITIPKRHYFLKQNIGMQSIATPINHPSVPLILVDLLPKVLVSEWSVVFSQGNTVSLPLMQSLGCSGQALIEIVWAGLSALLYFCVETVACCQQTDQTALLKPSIIYLDPVLFRENPSLCNNCLLTCLAQWLSYMGWSWQVEVSSRPSLSSGQSNGLLLFKDQVL